MLKIDKKILRQKLIAKIHIGKKYLKMSDDDYRILLKVCSDCIKESASKMNISELKEVLLSMKGLGFDYRKTNAKYFSALIEDTKYLTERQVKYIKGLWWEKANNPSEETLKVFINRITKKNSLGECEQSDANILIMALNSMPQANNKKNEHRKRV